MNATWLRSPSISSLTGEGDWFRTMRTSTPARFSPYANEPPHAALPMAPVSGLLQTTAKRFDCGAIEPFSGPVAKMSGLAGPSGSMPAGVMS